MQPRKVTIYSPLSERFHIKVKRTEGCWLWQGVKNRGYGMISDKGKMRYAHRVSYELAYGQIPDGLDILHNCDNPSCVRPDHLKPGTHTDNMRDMFAKGRRRIMRGVLNGRAKLTWEQVRVIRERYAAGGISLKQLADEHNVNTALVHRIIQGKAWKELQQQLT